MEQRDMKAVILLDKSAKFVESCNETFDFQVREGPKQKKLQIEKSIWTWCLEGIFEMHRILSDVYPRGTVQLRIAVADYMAKMLDNRWTRSFITRKELGALVETIGVPSPFNTDLNPIGGLTMAIEALAIESPEQKDYNYDVRYNLNRRTPQNSEVVRFTEELKGRLPLPKIQNNGNLIIYTRYDSEKDINELKKDVASLVISTNAIAHSPSNKTFCPITSLRVFIVNYYAAGDKCKVKTHPLKEYPDLPFLKFWVISRRAADMCNAIHSLLVAAFDMGSTTVTKIPMKEDNRGSTNYDVELFHSGKVHSTLRAAKLIDKVCKNRNGNEGVTYDTMRLTWTTAPKTKWSLFPYHKSASACTTSKAYSRPSACLTQFVRDGRCVMLDTEKSAQFGMNLPDKLISHILIANRGRIFIQEIDFYQKRLSKRRIVKKKIPKKRVRAPRDPLNINQLKLVYKQMELKLVAKNRNKDAPTEQQKQKWKTLKNSDIQKRLRRVTKNVPTHACDTFIFHKQVTPQLEPLIEAVTKLKLTENEVEQCRKAILKLHRKRSLKEFIIPRNTNIECLVEDLNDPEEQMRVAIVELAKHLAKYAPYSSNHNLIYKTFMSTMGADKILEIDLQNEEDIEKMFVKFPFFARSPESDTESGSSESSSDEEDESSDEDEDDDDICEESEEDDENGDNEELDSEDEDSDDELVNLRGFLRSTDNNRKRNNREIRDLGKDKVYDISKPIVQAKEIKLDILSNVCAQMNKRESKFRREFVGRELHGNKAPLYPQLAEKLESPASPTPTGERTERIERTDRPDRMERMERIERTERLRNLERGGSGTPPPTRRPFN